MYETGTAVRTRSKAKMETKPTTRSFISRTSTAGGSTLGSTGVPTPATERPLDEAGPSLVINQRQPRHSQPTHVDRTSKRKAIDYHHASQQDVAPSGMAVSPPHGSRTIKRVRYARPPTSPKLLQALERSITTSPPHSPATQRSALMHRPHHLQPPVPSQSLSTPLRTPDQLVAFSPNRILATSPSPALSDSEESLMLRPTPARVLLRQKINEDGEIESMEDANGARQEGGSSVRTLARPPTPPRVTERTERNGYNTTPLHSMLGSTTPKLPMSTPKRSRDGSPEAHPPTSIRRLDFSNIHTPRKAIAIIPTPSRPSAMTASSASSHSTTSLISQPRPSSTKTPSRPVLEPSLFTAAQTASTDAAGPTPQRQIAPLPLQTPARSFTTDPLPKTTPGVIQPLASCRKLTVPAPFKGASLSTKASEERERATAARLNAITVPSPRPSTLLNPTAPHQTRISPTPSSVKLTLTAVPLSTISVSEEMDIDQTTPSVEEHVAAPVTSALSGQSKKPSLAGLSSRRPPTRLSASSGPSQSSSIPIIVESSVAGSERPVKRKPSYPSYLGSGPQARPSARVVSNPILPPRSVSAPTTSPYLPLVPSEEEDGGNRTKSADSSEGSSFTSLSVPQLQQRVVSDPIGTVKPRTSLSMSQRREGFGLETNKSLHGLSEALEKLKVRRQTNVNGLALSSSSTISARPSFSAPSRLPPRPTVIVTPDESVTDDLTSRPSNLTASTSGSSRLPTAVHRPRTSLALQPLSRNAILKVTNRASSTNSIASADGLPEKCGSGASQEQGGLAGEGTADRSIAALMTSTSAILKGVVAFVDVKTGEGDDASAVFTDILRSCGAKVLTRPTESCTHIIFRAGKPSTLAWYRRQEEPRPHIVGITWVTRSKEAGRRLAENSFAVEVEEEDVFQKRRKSMEPKSLAASQSGSGPLTASTSTSARLLVPDTGMSVAAARRRTLMYAPKVSSPLKKSHLRSNLDDE